METEAKRIGALESVELLARRVASLPGELTSAPLPTLPDLRGLTRWVVSGVGASEGPCRLLVGQLLELGLSARFQPVTAFMGSSPPSGEVLVVISQRLSPNARIPLHRSERYRTVIVVTSLDPACDAPVAALEAKGVTVLRHGPVEENGLILRVLGPALASRMVLHLIASVARQQGGSLPAWTSRVAEIAPAIERAWARARPVEGDWVFGPAAILAAGDDGVLTTGLRSKLLEALGGPEPSIWDLCGVVHGPLQSFFTTRRLLFVLEQTDEPRSTFLRERLAKIIDPARHRIHVIDAVLPAPLSLFEYAAMFDAIVVAALRERPRDLADWPSKGRDGPIYELDGPALDE